MKIPPLKASLCLITLGIIWGSGYSLAHYATTHGVSPMGYALWQSLGPTLLLSLTLLLRGKKLPLDKTSIKLYLLTGLLGICIPNAIMYYGSAHLPAGLLAVVINTVPIFTYLIALCFKDENWQTPRALACALCFTGIVLLINQQNFSVQIHGIPWLLICLISPICFASTAVLTSKYCPPNCKPPQLAVGMLAISTLCLTPNVIGHHLFYSMHWPLQRNDQVILLEIILSSIGYLLFFYLLELAGSVYYSLVGGIVAITGVFWGHVIFHEHFLIKSQLAIAIIILSIIYMSIKPRSSKC